MSEYDYLYTPRALGPLTRDPQEREQERLANEARQYLIESSKMKLAQDRQSVEDDEAVRKLWPSLVMGGFSDDALKAALPQAGRSGPAVAEAVYKQKKSILDQKKTSGEIANKELETKAKQLEILGGAAEDELRRKGGPDHLSIQQLQSTATKLGWTMDPFDGDINNVDDRARYVSRIRGMAMKASEQAAARHADETAAQTIVRDTNANANAEADRKQRWELGVMGDTRTRELAAAAREQAAATRGAARETAAATREAAATTAASNKINAETQALAKFVDSNALPNLMTSATAVEEQLRKYEGKDLPGVGGLTGLAPSFLLSPEGKKLRSTLQAVGNDLLKLYSGGAVTASESDRRATEMMASGMFSDDDLRAAWPLVKGRIDAATQNARAGFSPEAVREYEMRGGLKLVPIGSHLPKRGVTITEGH